MVIIRDLLKKFNEELAQSLSKLKVKNENPLLDTSSRASRISRGENSRRQAFVEIT